MWVYLFGYQKARFFIITIIKTGHILYTQNSLVHYSIKPLICICHLIVAFSGPRKVYRLFYWRGVFIGTFFFFFSPVFLKGKYCAEVFIAHTVFPSLFFANSFYRIWEKTDLRENISALHFSSQI